MKKAYIDIAGKWAFIFAWGIGYKDVDEIASWLRALDATRQEIRKACRVILGQNHGFTFSSQEQRMSVMCISKSTDMPQWLDTIAHEVDHLQDAICRYYDVEPGTEDAAYLQGYIMRGITKAIIEEG